jgi:hypothetical protein
VVQDVSNDPLVAYRMGVLRVPHIEVFDSAGESVARFSYDVDPAHLYNTIEKIR